MMQVYIVLEMDEIKIVDGRACGHADYSTKIAYYCAGLVENME